MDFPEHVTPYKASCLFSVNMKVTHILHPYLVSNQHSQINVRLFFPQSLLSADYALVKPGQKMFRENVGFQLYLCHILFHDKYRWHQTLSFAHFRI